MTGRFQAGIGALIRSADDHRYLLLKRSAEKDVGAHRWECVTGRLEQSESFETALHREVMEELNVEVKPDFILKTSHFYRGEPIVENELLSVLYCCTISNPDAIHTSHEHSEARWVTTEEAQTSLNLETWLIDLLQRADLIYSKLPDDVLEFFRQNGYEGE